MKSAVEPSVAAAVEAVADRLARGCRHRAGAGEHRESGFRAEALRVRPGDDEVRREIGPTPGSCDERGCECRARARGSRRLSSRVSCWRARIRCAAAAHRALRRGRSLRASSAWAQMRAAFDELSESQSAELAAQRLWRHHDQCAELVDRGSACEHGAFARHQECTKCRHADRQGVVLASCSRPSASRAARMASNASDLAPARPLASPRSIDLDDALTLGDQEARRDPRHSEPVPSIAHTRRPSARRRAPGQDVAVAAARCGEVEFCRARRRSR